MARILLADDDQAMRDLVARALASDGHQVRSASDGQEALDLFEADPAAVDVLIADVQMPLVDGIALVVSARNRKPGLKAVLISALAGELSRAEALQGAGVRLLSKPFPIEQIRAIVRELAA